MNASPGVVGIITRLLHYFLTFVKKKKKNNQTQIKESRSFICDFTAGLHNDTNGINIKVQYFFSS